MTWTRSDPGAGDPGGIAGLAAQREHLAQRIRAEVIQVIARGFSGPSVDGWRAEAALALRNSVDETVPDVAKLVAQLQHDAGALQRYASEVAAIAEAADALRRAEGAQDSETSSLQRQVYLLQDAVRDGFDQSAASRLDLAELELAASYRTRAAIDEEWDALSARRSAADRVVIEAFGSSQSQGTLSPTELGHDFEKMSDAQYVAWLGGLSAVELLTLMRSDPSAAARLASVHDPNLVAGWWKALGAPVRDGEAPGTSALQASLILAIPAVLGNLDGIWYTHRDQANRIAFAQERDRVTSILDELQYRQDHVEEFAISPAEWLESQGYSLAELNRLYVQIGEVEQIQRTLEIGQPPILQFVLYQPGSPSLAAVSVGNMDTASQVTTNVSGMGSTITKTLWEWTATSNNIWQTQEHFNAMFGAETGLASVAWLGYDAPDMWNEKPGEVNVSGFAEQGGKNLQAFLEGITATRDWATGRNLSVIGHSYGTTTASFALEATPAENYVMLGSAGLDASIPDVTHLKVDASSTWASEAWGDWVADLGRIGTHPIDPTAPYFGANVFSSQSGYGPSGNLLPGSDWHPASPHLLGGAEYGYLDMGTHPLQSTALLSLGMVELYNELEQPRPAPGPSPTPNPSAG